MRGGIERGLRYFSQMMGNKPKREHWVPQMFKLIKRGISQEDINNMETRFIADAILALFIDQF